MLAVVKASKTSSELMENQTKAHRCAVFVS